MTADDCLYTGVFVNEDELEGLMRGIPRTALYRSIEHKHVTVTFKPKEIDPRLFGSTVRVRITGYGCDGRNEGLLAELHTDNSKLEKLFSQIKKPHITLSVSADGRPVDTAKLDFEPIEPFETEGIFGAMLKQGRVVPDTMG